MLVPNFRDFLGKLVFQNFGHPEKPIVWPVFWRLPFFFKSRFSTLAHLRFAICNLEFGMLKKVKVKIIWGLGQPWPALAPLGRLSGALRQLRVPPLKPPINNFEKFCLRS
jgi:hypothetical protein